MLEKPEDLELRATQDHFGFRLLEPVEKDWYVVQAMRTLLSVDASPFRLVFAGGTCLARAHKLVRRMSEDVDFKVLLNDMAPPSANMLRKVSVISQFDGLLIKFGDGQASHHGDEQRSVRT